MTHTHTEQLLFYFFTTALEESRYGCWFLDALGGSGSHEDGADLRRELTAHSEDRPQSGGAGPHTHRQEPHGDAQSRVLSWITRSTLMGLLFSPLWPHSSGCFIMSLSLSFKKKTLIKVSLVLYREMSKSCFRRISIVVHHNVGKFIVFVSFDDILYKHHDMKRSFLFWAKCSRKHADIC